MAKVKICGVTNAEDAILCASLGADFMGFNFFKDSPRKISIKHAKEVSSKVPGFIYQIADYNIAIGHQPHSEVAALAVLLDRLTDGKGRKIKFPDANVEIIPMEKGKNTKQKNKK